MKSTVQVNFKLLVKIVMSLGLLAFIFATAGIDHTFERLSNANLWYVPAGVAIYLASQWISAYRWQFLARPLGFDLSLREFFDYYMIGMYFNLFLPGSIGGDVGRVYYLAKSRNRRKREALLTLLAERGVGLVALLILTGIICMTPFSEPVPTPVKWGILALSAMMVAGFASLQVLPLQPLLNRFPRLALVDQARIYWQDLPMLAKSIALSLLVHGCMVWIHVLIVQALGIEINLIYLTGVYGIVTLASVTPLFFNGIGVREGAYVFLLVQVGISQPTALAFGLYWFVISLLTSLAGGLVFIKGHYKTPALEEEAEPV